MWDMRILFLTPQLPYPPRQGTAIRNFGLINGLAPRHTIDLLTFLATDESLTPNNPLLSMCNRVATIPAAPRPTSARIRDTFLSLQPDMALRLADEAFAAKLAGWLRDGKYDIVQAEGIEMGRYLLQARQQLAEQGARTKLVFDDHNCEYLLQQRNAFTDLRSLRRFPAGVYSLAQWRKLRRYEQKVCATADRTLAVSEPDASALRILDNRVDMIANGIDLSEYHVATLVEPPPPLLVFTGKMDYRPNVDAVLWFANQVLPLVLRARPDVRFQIVGRSPHPRLDLLRDNPAIEITGAVEDVRPYIAGAGVYVMPLRVGGGTRFKALEALAMGKPIVTTTLGVEGIGVVHRREVMIADTATTFALEVLALLDAQSAQTRQKLSENARDFVVARYGWEGIIARLEGVYERLLSVDEVASTASTPKST